MKQYGVSQKMIDSTLRTIIFNKWVPARETHNKARLFHFNLDEDKNNLIPVTHAVTAGRQFYPMVSIGKFTGRCEAAYRMAYPQNGLFVFVIEGAFEVQGRLLHPRDGLGLWDEPDDIELEALSNDAIVLLIELG